MRKYFAPGRINLIGEHIDYNGGLVLPAAISLGITAYVEPSNDERFHFSSASHSEKIAFALNEKFTYQKSNGWLNYVLGVWQFLQNNIFLLHPVAVHFESNLPEGSGLSSSAALEVLSMFLLLRESNYEVSPKQIALWCKEIENNFIGVSCGIMDQYTVANAKSENAMLLNCNSLETSYVSANFTSKKIVILNTKKPRSLIHSKFNERRAECEKALAVINRKKLSEHQFLCECNLGDLRFLDEPKLKLRATHVITENHRVIKAAEALTNNHIDEFEDLLNQSHRSLKENYEVSGNELDAIVEAATSHPACKAARMTGAGFGGCAIALVEENAIDDFNSFVKKKYFAVTGLQAEIYLCQLSEGVKLVLE